MAQFSLNFGWVLGSYQNISTKVESVKENKYLTAPKDHSVKCLEKAGKALKCSFVAT